MANLATHGLGAQSGKRLTCLIWGPPGSRKTVVAHGMPRTRTIDFDDGLQSVEWAIRAGILKKSMEEIEYETILGDRETVKGVVDMLNVAMDCVDRWIAEEDEDPSREWDTLIVDSCSFMSDAAVGLALSENKRLGLSKSLEDATRGLTKEKRDRGLYVRPMRMQDWGAAVQLFQNAVLQWRGLSKNLVLVAHEWTNTDADGNVKEYAPLFIGQARQKIPALCDEVWFSQVLPRGKSLEATFRTVAGPRRPTIKSRAGCLDAVEPADFAAIRRKIAKFYNIPEEDIWRTSHGIGGRERAGQDAAEAASMV